MKATIATDFNRAITELTSSLLREGSVLQPNFWQSRDVSNSPQAATIELLNQSLSVSLRGKGLALGLYRKEIKPNLPWADRHFELERSSGEPLNPGTTWAEWPWGSSANTFRTEQGQFDHSYAERFWPKYAGLTEGGRLPDRWGEKEVHPHRGPRFSYGDLGDVVNLLAKDPLTRQAVLPVFFPEDTGAIEGQRVPCTLFYHFIQREGEFHVIYSIRSCDALRHFRDDVYLTIRLMLWVLERLQHSSPSWVKVRPGSFTMHITSFHCFVGDRMALEKQLKAEES